MMGALIVGGDHVAPYRSFLEQRGFAAVQHWNGRRHSECHRRIPGDTELILVLVDQVNHGLARKVRRLAGEMGVPVLFSRRSRGQLDDALAIHGLGACPGVEGRS